METQRAWDSPKNLEEKKRFGYLTLRLNLTK